jgi:hypothetical protein
LFGAAGSAPASRLIEVNVLLIGGVILANDVDEFLGGGVVYGLRGRPQVSHRPHGSLARSTAREAARTPSQVLGEGLLARCSTE